MKTNIIIIGAGPGGIFSAYELIKLRPDLKITVFHDTIIQYGVNLNEYIYDYGDSKNHWHTSKHSADV